MHPANARREAEGGAAPLEEGAQPVGGRAVSLRARHVCRRLLIWECRLDDPKRAARLPDRLLQAGFSDVSRFDWVREFVDDNEDSVIVVPKTGRVEIRVHYLTPLDERTARAHRMEARLEDALRAP